MDIKPGIAALTFVIATHIITSNSFADSAKDTCEKAASLAEKNPKAALEEARWCVEMLEQSLQKFAATLFPDKLSGFKGEKITQQKTMGFAVTERSYKKDKETIKVSLNEGKAAGLSMAALSQFGAMAGGQKIRVQSRTGVVMPEDYKTTISFSLKSGGSLVFETTNAGREALEAFCKEFPIAKLDDAL